MSADPQRISIAILAIGGQGGGVLADWLVDLAEDAGWLVQTTSVPGVAQRTGATVYYAELFSTGLFSATQAAGTPVLALMPTPGDVDVVIAAELMEAGRAMQRGLITPDRTTLIASSHRAYAILEKSALGNGIADADAVHAAAKVAARRYVCFDMASLAEEHGSVISASLFGALAGAQVLPFAREAFEAAIRRGGVGVESSLRAFAAAYTRATQGDAVPAASASNAEAGSAAALATAAGVRHPAVDALLTEIRQAFPAPAHAFLIEGARRLVDHMDLAYAHDYLQRVRAVAVLDARYGGERSGFRATRETARYLALWMAYEDVMRVADLKTRAARFERFRKEVRAAPGQIVHVTEFLHPRVQEVADVLPPAFGRWLLATPWARNTVTRLAGKRTIRTARLRGFVTLWLLGRLGGYRRKTLRYAREMRDIGTWLARIEHTMLTDYDLACEVAECARVLKGYSETYERGRRSFDALMQAADALAGKPDAAHRLRALHAAALQDEDGCALKAGLSELDVSSAR
ncbi:MAG: indolepyruvate oxidoreductase subunit beta family protein [Burkholderiales bacterium]|nr:indolepyruvate oxidoreductase subunit beta family protein [Burkholderiales bacterium]